MSFPTFDDLNSKYWNLSSDNLALGEILISALEEYLANVGLSFVFATKTIKLNSDLETGVYDLPYCQSITSVKVKSYDSTYEHTLTSTDYKVTRHIKSPNPIFRIEIINSSYSRIKIPYYIEVVGSFGFATTIPAGVELAIANIGKRYFNLVDTNFQSIKNSEIGDSKTEYQDIAKEDDDQAVANLEFNKIKSLQTALSPYIL